jgi:hypothetical protein
MRRAYHPLFQRILLANEQSLDNKVDKLRARISFQIRDSKTLPQGIMALTGYIVRVHTASWVLSTLHRQEKSTLCKKRKTEECVS